jgi:hypothetical protein
MDIPMLEDSEADYVLRPFSLGEDRDDLDAAKREVLQRYFALTGFKETNANAVFHHVVTLYGAPCSNCGKPLRTPRAKWCAACGSFGGLTTGSQALNERP